MVGWMPEEGSMEKILLQTADGGFVETAEIPELRVYPDVVTWGSRVFQLVTKT